MYVGMLRVNGTCSRNERGHSVQNCQPFSLSYRTKNTRTKICALFYILHTGITEKKENVCLT